MQLRVYRPVVADGFEWVQPVDERDFDAVYRLDGQPRGTSWTPVRVRRIVSDGGVELSQADTPWLDGQTIVSRAGAHPVLRNVLGGAGESLELALEDGQEQLWLFNVCTVVDALDESRSDLIRFPSSGGAMKITRHEFLPDRVAGLAAFRIPQARGLHLGGEAVAAISGRQFAGLHFQEVWESSST